MKLNNRKVRILRKLVESGADTEKKILDLGLVEIIKISKSTSLSFQEMELINELKEAVKEKKVISYLVEKEGEDGTEEGNERNGEEGRSDSDLGAIESFY